MSPPVAWFQAIFMLTQAKRGFRQCGRIARGKIPFVVAVQTSEEGYSRCVKLIATEGFRKSGIKSGRDSI